MPLHACPRAFAGLERTGGAGEAKRRKGTRDSGPSSAGALARKVRSLDCREAHKSNQNMSLEHSTAWHARLSPLARGLFPCRTGCVVTESMFSGKCLLSAYSLCCSGGGGLQTNDFRRPHRSGTHVHPSSLRQRFSCRLAQCHSTGTRAGCGAISAGARPACICSSRARTTGSKPSPAPDPGGGDATQPPPTSPAARP